MALWPLPSSFSYGSMNLWLSPELQFAYRKVEKEQGGSEWYRDLKWPESDPFVETGSPSKVIQYPMDLLQTAFERFKTRVFSQNIVPAKFHPRRACFEPNLDEPRTSIIKVIIEEQDDDHPRVSKEAYAIDISPDDPIIKIRIVFASGALRAFDSLAQLFYAHSRSEKDVYTPFAPVSIRDAPSFEHRGLMLDISRNRISSQDVLRTIDAMGFNKLNRLHLHATDSQSWPLEIPSLPTLAKEGAYAEDQIWSVEDLEKVQRYGLYRGVEVYLEIDMPGHTGSIVHAYPELVVAYNQRPWEKYAQEPPSGQLKLNSPEVGSFLTTLLNDLLPRVSTYNTRFHIGGDELNTEVYEMDCTVKSSEKRVIRPFLQKFMNEILSIVDSHSLTPHVWEDMLVDWALDFPSHTIFQNWRRGGLRKIVDQGYRAIFGESDEWYLDSGFGTFIDPIGEDSPIKHPFADWCPPYKNWRRVLAYNPLKDIPKEKQHLVIGGEVHLWTELTDSVTLDFMLWPRAAAAAEMMWRGGGEVGENTTRRLAVMRERLLKMGIRAGVVQMEWALRNPGECVL